MKRILTALLVLSLASSSMVLASCRDKDSSESNGNLYSATTNSESSEKSMDYYDKIGDIASKVKEEYGDKSNSSSTSDGDNIVDKTEYASEIESSESGDEYPAVESAEN